MQAQPSVPLIAEPLATMSRYVATFSEANDHRPMEIVAGQPVVTPSPGGPHQVFVARLVVLFGGSCPPGWLALPAPLDWVLWEHPLQVRQPDVVVVTRAQAAAPYLTTPPLLAVEVLSPSTFERDAVTKREEYARAGLRHYWLVDPTVPSIAAYQLVNERLVQQATATGDELLRVDAPFPVRVRPRQLDE